MDKKFKLDAAEIRELVALPGYCTASDEITVHGKKVGYMYIEEPAHEYDSGWNFFAGSETQEYTDNADNLGLYRLNTIANYDPDIIPFLESDFGKAFARDASGVFIEEQLIPLAD